MIALLFWDEGKTTFFSVFSAQSRWSSFKKTIFSNPVRNCLLYLRTFCCWQNCTLLSRSCFTLMECNGALVRCQFSKILGHQLGVRLYLKLKLRQWVFAKYELAKSLVAFFENEIVGTFFVYIFAGELIVFSHKYLIQIWKQLETDGDINRLAHGNVIPMGIPWETSHRIGQV